MDMLWGKISFSRKDLGPPWRQICLSSGRVINYEPRGLYKNLKETAELKTNQERPLGILFKIINVSIVELGRKLHESKSF